MTACRTARVVLSLAILLAVPSTAPARDDKGGYFSREGAVGPDGTIYLATKGGGMNSLVTQGGVYAFNPDTSLKWVYPLANQTLAPPVVFDQTVYVGTDGAPAYLYALPVDPATCSPGWASPRKAWR